MSFCLIKSLSEKLLKAVESGEFNPDKLDKMSSREVRDYFAKFVGEENARQVNLLYEKKSLLINQEKAIQNFYREILGDKEYLAQKEKLAQGAKDRAALRKQKIYSPAENAKELDEIISDAYSKKYKSEVTLEQAQNIVEFTSNAQGLKEKHFDFEKGNFKTKEGAAEYGMAEAISQNYLENIKGADDSLSELYRNRMEEFKSQKNSEGIFKALSDLTGTTSKNIKQMLITLIGSNDVSFGFRQGFTALLDSPKVWWNGFYKQFGDIGKAFKGNAKEAKLLLDAEKYARPNYILGIDEIAGLGKKIIEEETVAGNLLEKVPFLGRDLQASDIAFNGMAQRVRYGIFDKHIELLKKMGEDVFDKKVASQATDIAFRETGRAKIGKKSLFDSPIFWAPKMIISAAETLITPFNPYKSSYVRVQATKTLLKYAAIYIASKTIQNALNPGSADNDPRATKFKNIATLGNTNISIGRGELSLITLASRLVPTLHNGELGFWSIDNNGIYKKFEGDFGQTTPFDAVINFLSYKTNPYASIVVDYLKQSMYGGQKITLPNELYSFQPISFQNFEQAVQNKDSQQLIGAFLDLFGASANTYKTETDWGESTTKEMTQFKEKVGQSEFEKANKEFNNKYNDKLKVLLKNPEYLAMSDEDKQGIIAALKSKIKKDIFNKYNFKYKE